MFKALILIIVLLTASNALAGEFITELGGGFMERQKSSYILTQDCKSVVVINPTTSPREIHFPYSCGGDDPLFIGWPIAYEFNNGNTRIGWFHYSHWFDNRGETQFNCLCASHKITWKNFKRNKRGRR